MNPTIAHLADAVATSAADEVAAADTQLEAQRRHEDARLELAQAEARFASDPDNAPNLEALAALEHGVRLAQLRADATVSAYHRAVELHRRARVAHALAEIQAFQDDRLGRMRTLYTAIVHAVRDLRDMFVAWDSDLRTMKRAWRSADPGNADIDARLAELPTFPARSRDDSHDWFGDAVKEGQVGYRVRASWAHGGRQVLLTHLLHTPDAVRDMRRRWQEAEQGAPQPIVYGPVETRYK